MGEVVFKEGMRVRHEDGSEGHLTLVTWDTIGGRWNSGSSFAVPREEAENFLKPIQPPAEMSVTTGVEEQRPSGISTAERAVRFKRWLDACPVEWQEFFQAGDSATQPTAKPRTFSPRTIAALTSALGANAPDESHPLLAAIASLEQEADDLAALTADPHLSSSLARLSVRIGAALELAREYVSA